MTTGLKAFLVLTCVLFVATTQAAEKVRFGTPIKGAAHQELPQMAAYEKGFWKENDLDVQWVSFDAGTVLIRALAAGAVDLASTLAPDLVTGVARGVPIIMVADAVFRNDFLVAVRIDSPIRELKDLRGTKLGIPAFGSVAHAYGVAMAKALGWEKDMRLVAAGGTAANIAALKAGAVHGVIQTIMVVLPLQFRGEVRPVVNLRDFLPKDWVDLVIVARTDFVEKSPALVKRAVKAWLQAVSFIMDNPDWTVAKLKDGYGHPEATARGIYNLLKYSRDGNIDAMPLENVQKFLVEYGLLPKEQVSPRERLFTRRFIE